MSKLLSIVDSFVRRVEERVERRLYEGPLWDEATRRMSSMELLFTARIGKHEYKRMVSGKKISREEFERIGKNQVIALADALYE